MLNQSSNNLIGSMAVGGKRFHESNASSIQGTLTEPNPT